ncbi:MAG TPA: hypothetical protein VIW22_05430 [Nitrososphaerales archaeon]
MNRDLFGFAILLVLLGIGFGIYLISFFGLILMIPAFLARSRQKSAGPPVPAKQPPPRRISPPAVRQAEPWVSTPKQPAVTPAPAYAPPLASASTTNQTPTFEVPIFPNSMFPSLSPTSAANPAEETTTPKPTQQDELLQVGAILALLRFAFG